MFAEIPFEPDRQYSASVRLRDGRYEVFVKGAPERVLAMCTSLAGEDGEREASPEEVLEAARHLAPTQFVLRVEPVADLAAWGRIAGVAATIIVAMEIHKWARRRPGGYPWGARRPKTY